MKDITELPKDGEELVKPKVLDLMPLIDLCNLYYQNCLR